MSCANTKEWKPYLYLLTQKSTGYKYIGCRYARDCNPDDLLVSYMSSSKDVNYIIKRDGKEAFDKKILKVFDVNKIIKSFMLLDEDNSDIMKLYDKEHFNAIKKYVLSQESKLLRRLKVKHRHNFFNKTDGTEGRSFYKAMRRVNHG